MNRRIRVAVILVQDGKILLVKHVDPVSGEEWWIPPGGGLEPQDRSIVDCAKREVFEETGMHVSLGRLVYLREFWEEMNRTHHVELFFLAQEFSGEPTIANAIGKGPDSEWIRQVAWLGRSEVKALTVYPEELADSFWRDLSNGFPSTEYLGMHQG